MPQPQPGQPYVDPGIRISVGDPDPATPPGTDAYNGVVVIEAGVATNYIVDPTVDFEIKVYIKTVLEWAPFPLDPATFTVDFHIHDLAGTPAGGPYAGNPLILEALPPDGAVPEVPPEEITWYSSTVLIPANTLAADSTYRITVDADDAANNVFAFHDGTVIHTQ